MAFPEMLSTGSGGQGTDYSMPPWMRFDPSERITQAIQFARQAKLQQQSQGDAEQSTQFEQGREMTQDQQAEQDRQMKNAAAARKLAATTTFKNATQDLNLNDPADAAKYRKFLMQWYVDSESSPSGIGADMRALTPQKPVQPDFIKGPNGETIYTGKGKVLTPPESNIPRAVNIPITAGSGGAAQDTESLDRSLAPEQDVTMVGSGKNWKFVPPPKPKKPSPDSVWVPESPTTGPAHWLDSGKVVQPHAPGKDETLTFLENAEKTARALAVKDPSKANLRAANAARFQTEQYRKSKAAPAAESPGTPPPSSDAPAAPLAPGTSPNGAKFYLIPVPGQQSSVPGAPPSSAPQSPPPAPKESGGLITEETYQSEMQKLTPEQRQVGIEALRAAMAELLRIKPEQIGESRFTHSPATILKKKLDAKDPEILRKLDELSAKDASALWQVAIEAAQKTKPLD